MSEKQGSFGLSRENIEATIRAQREVEARKEDAESKDVEAVESGLEKKINEYLPKKVYSLSRDREYEYDEFKKLYKQVWDAVSSKDHLMTGAVSITTTLGGSEIRVRSLSAREAQGLARWENETFKGGANEKTEFLLRRLVVQVERVNDLVINKAVKLNPNNVEEWEKDPTVKQAYEFFAEKDITLLLTLSFILDDLDMAKQLALTENLKRP